jgi:hypothetical protein
MSIRGGPPVDPLTLELLDLMPVVADAKLSIPFTMQEWMDHLGDLSYNSAKSTCDRQNGHNMVHIGPDTLDGEPQILFCEFHR